MKSTDPAQAPRDEATVAYFDSHVPEYSVGRLDRAVEFIRAHAQPGASLIDLGCGTGNTLAYLHDQTPIGDVAGLDVSARCLEIARQRASCETYLGSIFDRSIVPAIGRTFDFVVVAAVLHHLIGRTRSASRAYARTAVGNALALLPPGGHLIVLEPIFYPSWAMNGLFYLKKGVSRITDRRVPIGGYWNNIGPPVVSYYTNEELRDMVLAGGRVREVVFEPDEAHVPRLVRRVMRKTNTTLIVEML